MYHSTQRNDSPDLPDIVPNEFQEITPLVQTPAVSSRSQKSILVLGSSLIGLFIACSAVWYCFKDSRESDTDDTFTGLAELATCGRKLMWAAHPGMCAAAKGAYHGAEVALQPCGTLGFLDEWIFTQTGEAKRARLASSPQFCLDFSESGQSLPWCQASSLRVFRLQIQSKSAFQHNQERICEIPPYVYGRSIWFKFSWNHPPALALHRAATAF